MDAELRKILSKLVLGIRHLLEGIYDDRGVWHAGDLEQRLNQIGVWRDRPVKPLEELPQLSEADNKARRTVEAYLKYREETGVNRAEVVEEFIRESAYTWFNRLFALRCMEARGIIDEVIHQKDIYGGRSLQHNRLTIRHPELCTGEDDGLYAVLFQEFERRVHELPMLFIPESPAVSLRPSVSAIKNLVSILSGREPVNGEYASDEVFMAPDAFGWAYQYWNAEEKDRVFEKVRIEKTKIKGKDIIPVTCIYTEPYMVKFLVQNSLGAQWSCMHPESSLYEGWEYYVRDADRSPVKLKSVREITFLDPACGSGHFLLDAFDLYFDMYREEGELVTPEDICASILENNLYGIDIDERAVQISVAVLWMKAKEKAPGLYTAGLSGFHSHLMATNIKLPKGRDHLEEFLRKHPEDKPLRSALELIFNALENVDEIGSLLKIEEPLEYVFKDLTTAAGIQTTLWSNGFTSLDSWLESVLGQLIEHFNEEAVSSDLTQAFWGKNMNKGFNLFNAFSMKYDVVATNPPYMGSGNMSELLKKYTEENYTSGKRDLFASFILRCLDFSKENSWISMVTQHSWLFLRSFSELRARKTDKGKKGVLYETEFEVLAYLGPRAFHEISGEIVNIALCIFRKKTPHEKHRLFAFDVAGEDSPNKKSTLLRDLINQTDDSFLIYKPKQSNFTSIPESPISYNLPDKFFNLLNINRLSDYASVVTGLQTSNDPRYVRFFWEVNPREYNKTRKERRWFVFKKGGGYGRWCGNLHWMVDWENQGIRIKCYPNSYVRNERHYFKKGYTYSYMGSKSLGVRIREGYDIFGHAEPAIIPNKEVKGLASILNSRISTYIVRSINKKIAFNESYISRISIAIIEKNMDELENLCIKLKNELIKYNLLEYDFDIDLFHLTNLKNSNHEIINKQLFTSSMLHTYEGYIESIIFKAYNFNEKEVITICKEVGTPVGWNEKIIGYDKLLSVDLKIIQQSNNNFDQPSSKLIDPKKIKKIKEIIQTILSIGPNVKINDINKKLNFSDILNLNNIIHIPFESFVEKISTFLNIHPISTFWLLTEGIRTVNWRYIPEERRITENRYAVIILRLLGYLWPKQIKTGEVVPDWADPDGVIPLTEGTEESTLLNRIRERLNEENDTNNLKVEREFEELMGKPLEEWLLYDFFKHHQSQFKKRPVAWQIQSTPLGSSRRGRGRRVEPAFSCLVYCQKVDEDTLHKIRTQYVGPLKNRYEAEFRTLETIGLLNTEQTVRRTNLEMLIDELEEFDTKLQGVINEGFDSKELEKLMRDEPLDNWCSIDGKEPPPDSHEGLYLQERAYIPDINDGVRVNIAPLQKAGLLAFDVLAKKDVERAISDRAKWRSDERRWCREGKLPQPGWWEKRKLDDKPR